MRILQVVRNEGRPVQRVICDGVNHVVVDIRTGTHTAEVKPCPCPDRCRILEQGVEVLDFDLLRAALLRWDGPQVAAVLDRAYPTGAGVEPAVGPVVLNSWKHNPATGLLLGTTASRNPNRDPRMPMGTAIEVLPAAVTAGRVVTSLSGVQFYPGEVDRDHEGKPTGQWPAAF